MTAFQCIPTCLRRCTDVYSLAVWVAGSAVSATTVHATTMDCTIHQTGPSHLGSWAIHQTGPLSHLGSRVHQVAGPAEFAARVPGLPDVLVDVLELTGPRAMVKGHCMLWQCLSLVLTLCLHCLRYKDSAFPLHPRVLVKGHCIQHEGQDTATYSVPLKGSTCPLR